LRFIYQQIYQLVVIVVVSLYSASRSGSNVLIIPLRHKKMSFQSRAEAAGTPSRVPECVEVSSITSDPQQKKPDNQMCCGGVVEPQLVTVGRPKASTAWDVRCTRAAVHQVLRSPILQTPVNCNSRDYTGHVVECPANEAWREAVGTSCDQTSGFHWPLELWLVVINYE